MTIAIKFGQVLPVEIALELRPHWSFHRDGYNWYDIPLPASDKILDFIENIKLQANAESEA